jgi:hypothetical protein
MNASSREDSCAHREHNRPLDCAPRQHILEDLRSYVFPKTDAPVVRARQRMIADALHLCDESVMRAAKLLSMAHGSLSDWLARRSLPGKAGMTDEEEDGDP